MANKFKNTKGLDSTIIPLTSFNESKVLSDKNYKVLEDNKQNNKVIRLNNIGIIDLIYLKEDNFIESTKNNKYISVGLLTNLKYKENGKPIIIFFKNINRDAIAILQIKKALMEKPICKISINVKITNITDNIKSKDEYPFRLDVNMKNLGLAFL